MTLKYFLYTHNGTDKCYMFVLQDFMVSPGLKFRKTALCLDEQMALLERMPGAFQR